MAVLTDTNEIVRSAVESDGAIRSDLARGLINVRALARHIQRKARTAARQEISLDAIISAIRRYPIQQSTTVYQNVGRLLQKLTMRNKIVDVAVLNSPEIPSALGKIASQIDYGRGEAFRVVAGVESIRLVLDEKNLDKLSILPKKKILKVVGNLAEVIISLSNAAERTPGVVATVTTELAMNGINMIEFMSCVPELILVVEEKDALRTYESLERLAKGSRDIG